VNTEQIKEEAKEPVKAEPKSVAVVKKPAPASVSTSSAYYLCLSNHGTDTGRKKWL
jgi:hypothetical protein